MLELGAVVNACGCGEYGKGTQVYQSSDIRPRSGLACCALCMVVFEGELSSIDMYVDACMHKMCTTSVGGA